MNINGKMKFRVANFRNLKDVELKIKPITLLFGNNGSGKSTFLKSLLFFSKNCLPYPMGYGNPKVKIKFYLNTVTHLGSFSEVVFDGGDKILLTIKIEKEIGKVNLSDFREYDKVELINRILNGKGKKISVNCEFEVRALKDSTALIHRVKLFDDNDKTYFEFYPSTQNKELKRLYGFEAPIFNFKFFQNKNLDKAITKILMEDNEVAEDGIPFYGSPSMKIDNLEKYLSDEPKSTLNEIQNKNKLIELLIKYYFLMPGILEGAFERITYLPSIRELPHRNYVLKDYTIDENIYAGIFREIDKEGKKIVEVELGTSSAEGSVLFRRNGKWAKHERVATLLNRLLKEFELGEEIRIEQKDEFLLPKLKLMGSKKYVSLSEGSSGLHQLLPILVKLLSNDDDMVLIEQPELHLHPKLQARLADIFVDRELIGNKKLIIETHSEHLIKKLQVLIAKGDLTREDIAVYYFSSKHGESKVKLMEMDERGLFIEDWPDEFFDDSTNLTLELFQALKYNKQKSN